MLDNILSRLKLRADKGPVLGVDIGTISVKVAEVIPQAGKLRLSNYGLVEIGGYLERSNSVIQTSSLKMDEAETAGLLKEAVHRMGTRTKQAIGVVPSFASFTSLIELPPMTAQELEQAIPYQARSLVPLPISEVAIDWINVGSYEDDNGNTKQQILLISVPNDQIASYQSVFKRAGLKLKYLEIEGLSLARSLTYGSTGNILIIDIGAFTTTIVIADGGSLRFVGQTDFSGNSLTQALSKGLGITPRRAEALKKQRGLSGMTGEYGLSTLMLPFVDVILNEVRRVRDVFEGKHKKKIDKILLSGGGGDLIGFSEYVQKQLGIPTEKGDPFRNVSYPPESAPLVRNIASRFSVAVGAGAKDTS
ncbi:MAG: type IV pilus assembly protein PilM [Candidatus Colwellbacteria bacterium]|nr:type IV pilus assembly protein PilM [Candidatus Colwellbacteria bacterium]